MHWAPELEKLADSYVRRAMGLSGFEPTPLVRPSLSTPEHSLKSSSIYLSMQGTLISASIVGIYPKIDASHLLQLLGAALKRFARSCENEKASKFSTLS